MVSIGILIGPLPLRRKRSANRPGRGTSTLSPGEDGGTAEIGSQGGVRTRIFSRPKDNNTSWIAICQALLCI